MEIIIINKIEDKINEYQEKTGVTKTWIAKQLNISRQRLSNIMKAENLQVDVLAKIAILIDCRLDDLIEFHSIEK